MARNRPTILLVEDDPKYRRAIARTLEQEDYRLLEAENAATGLLMLQSHNPEVALVDLGLPDFSGAELIRRARPGYTGAILILSAQDQEEEKVRGLDWGADDYLTKPVGTQELLARIRVGLRRRYNGVVQQSLAGGLPTFRAGGLEVDLAARSVKIDGRDIPLTPTEFKVLAVLVANQGRVVTHAQLLREVWGQGAIEQPQYIRVFLAGLRKKLESDPANPKYIRTELGVGYRMTGE